MSANRARCIAGTLQKFNLVGLAEPEGSPRGKIPMLILVLDRATGARRQGCLTTGLTGGA